VIQHPPHYFESHVTTDPVSEDDLEDFQEICARHMFKVAELIKQNGTPSDRDAFCSGRSYNYSELLLRMARLVHELNSNARFNVRRFKVEAVLFDSKCQDSLT
jgi:hypothetical protein